MKLRISSSYSLALTALPILLLTFAIPASAQRPVDPDNSATAKDKERTDADEAGAAPAGPEAEATTPFEEPVETDPIVLAVRDSNPKTPNELARAVGILLDAKRYDVAKTYLAELTTAVADDRDLFRVYEKYGPAWFLRLARTKELAPEGEQLARRALEVAQTAARNPARINALIDQLADRKTRGTTISQLRRGGSAVVGTLIAALGDPNRSNLHKPIQSALLALGKDAVEPLIAALESNDPELQARIIAVLDAIGDRRALAKLAELAFASDVPESVRDVARRSIASSQGKIPSKQAVGRFLTNRFLEVFRDRKQETQAGYIEDSAREDGVVPGEVTIWQWDAASQQVVSQNVTRETAERQDALRVAQALVAVAPDVAEYRKWQLAALFDWQQATAGLDENLVAEPGPTLTAAEEAGPQLVNDVLQLALDMKREASAIAAANALGAIGDQQVLHVMGGKTAPLVEALQDTEPRVQFAAAMAIMRINPTEPFAGSSRFRDTLALMLGSAIANRALVANPNLGQAQTWGGMLTAFGWEPEIVGSGDELLQRISKSPYYEFVLLNDAIENPALTELLQLVRQTSGGGEMPIAVLCRPETYRRLKEELDGQPLLIIMPLPANEEIARIAVKRVTSLPGRRMPPSDIRQLYAANALEWIRLTADSPYASVYDLVYLEEPLDKLLYDSPLAEKATQVLGVFGTRDAQKRLVDIASQPAYDAALRKAAAQAFINATSKRGVMLTNTEILQQYERYNASAKLSAENQEILDPILNALDDWLKATQESTR